MFSVYVLLLFLFKPKTAYEMRISDWSSDVCSSDLVEAGAGAGIDFDDRDYVDVGAAILPDARAVFAAADMIVKVKEPQPQEIALLEPHHLLFTYLHLAADKPQTEDRKSTRLNSSH